ncbi:RNA polymerase sigma factor [Povalibacter sp.]|nr:sigma-70 family RNA polymerase sigma factor [Povalibacter sp.]
MFAQDRLYEQSAREFGPALSRVAAAYESNATHRQDLLQDMHVALWRSFATYRNQCSLRTWIHRVAHNVAATHALRQKRSRTSKWVDLEEVADVADALDGERAADETVVLGKLMELVHRLRPVDRPTRPISIRGNSTRTRRRNRNSAIRTTSRSRPSGTAREWT